MGGGGRVSPHMSSPLAIEKHYTPSEISAVWNIAPSKVRELFANEPGVMRIGEPSRREGRKLVRSYFSMRVPESTMLRVHARLTSLPAVRRPA
jgi:hypothetical protein